MSATGRLMGQDLLQMINAGFNPLQQISKTTGESLVELKKRMEDGGISADEVRQAFEAATAEGGMFHGMTDRLAETVSGKMNIALSDMEKQLAAVGKELGPLIIQLLDAFQQMKPIIDIIVALIGQIAKVHALTIAMITDIINSVKSFSIDTTATDKFYADMKKKAKEQADEAKRAGEKEFEQRLDGVDDVAQAEMRAAREAEAARLKAIEEQQKAAEKAWKKNIEDDRKARLKAIEDARKAQEKARQKAEEDFQKELESARNDAMKFFDDQKKKNDERREAVAKGPGSGMEVGSSESVKFAADMANAEIARKAVPELKSVTNGDIAAKTAELVEEQRHANRMQAQQIELASQMLAEQKENGFRRLR